jgi:drug/metabolite transporter (DMT)-like permease
MVEVRLVLAAVVLVGFVAARRGLPALRPALRPGAFVGVCGMAVPFFLISWGETHVDSGVAAVANSSVPIFVALLALRFAAGERSSGSRVLGLAIGLAGVGVAIADRVSATGHPLAVVSVVLGMLGFAAGTLYQRRFGATMDLRTGTAIQLGTAAVVGVPLAALTHGLGVPMAFDALGPLAWLTIVNSIGVMMLFAWLLRRGRSSSTASLLYVVPPTTGLLAVPLLGQPLVGGVVAGLAITLAGVALVNRGGARSHRSGIGTRASAGESRGTSSRRPRRATKCISTASSASPP